MCIHLCMCVCVWVGGCMYVCMYTHSHSEIQIKQIMMNNQKHMPIQWLSNRLISSILLRKHKDLRYSSCSHFSSSPTSSSVFFTVLREQRKKTITKWSKLLSVITIPSSSSILSFVCRCISSFVVNKLSWIYFLSLLSMFIHMRIRLYRWWYKL